MRRLVLSLALLAIAASPARPSLRLIVSPHAGFAPLTVRARAWAKDPGRVLHCPTVIWDWGDGSRSSHAEDCDPYEMEGQEPDRYAPDPPAPHVYRTPGDYTVTVTFRPAVGRTVASWQGVMVR